MRYPRAGTDNALVTLHLFDVATGDVVDVLWDDAAPFEYLTRVLWDQHGLAIEVVARDFTEARVLAVDTSTGATSLLVSQTDPLWIEPTRGVPARLDDGRLVSTVHHGDVRALAVDGERVTPDDLHVAEVLQTAGDAVLVVSSHGDPTQDHVWRVVPGQAPARLTSEEGLHTATTGGDVTVVKSWLADALLARTQVLRGAEVLVEMTNLAEEPVVSPCPRYLRVGNTGSRPCSTSRAGRSRQARSRCWCPPTAART